MEAQWDDGGPCYSNEQQSNVLNYQYLFTLRSSTNIEGTRVSYNKCDKVQGKCIYVLGDGVGQSGTKYSKGPRLTLNSRP